MWRIIPKKERKLKTSHKGGFLIGKNMAIAVEKGTHYTEPAGSFTMESSIHDIAERIHVLKMKSYLVLQSRLFPDYQDLIEYRYTRSLARRKQGLIERGGMKGSV